jgi:hypothetical protein
LPDYRGTFGDAVLTFSKSEIVKTFEEGDNFNDRRAIIYARNACFDLARQVGCKYFMQLDDDYSQFHYKFDAIKRYSEARILDLDAILAAMVEYFESIPVLSIAMSQNGDFLGGKTSTTAYAIYLKRKAMNTFVCSADRPFTFVGRINEDVNTYTSKARTGGLFLTVMQTGIIQKETQSTDGGMTELYRDSGTYIKSFYSVMYSPSSVKVREMGHTHRRLHHSVNWNATAPKILREEWRKP